MINVLCAFMLNCLYVYTLLNLVLIPEYASMSLTYVLALISKCRSEANMAVGSALAPI